MALNREAVIRSAEKYVAKGKLEHAIKEYRKVLAENPNDANTLNRVGDLYARIERFDEAVKLFSQIAEQYTKDGFFVKAIAIYKKIIKLDPSALAVYERLAELYYKQGLLNEARTQYQVLADYYQKHDNATSATTIYQKMSQMEPENPSFHLKLAELYTGQRLTDKAMREYRLLADILIVNGSVDEATQVYEKALEVDSDDLEFVREAISGLNDNGHVGAAAKVLAKAVSLNPEARSLAAQAGLGGDAVGGDAVGSDAVGGDAVGGDTVGEDMAGADPFDDGASAVTAPPSTEAASQASAKATSPPPDDDVFEIDLEDDLSVPSFADDPVAYVPGDESPFGDADTLGASATSFDDSAPAVDVVSFDSTPNDETDGLGSFATPTEEADEVFTFDLDDDEIPSSQVMPPDDLDSPPVTLDEAPDIELELDLGGVGLGEVGLDDVGLDDGGTEELGELSDTALAADDTRPGVDDAFDLGSVDLEEPSEGIEIDWSMDSIDELDVGLAIGGGDVQPVEVEELDLGGFDDLATEASEAGDETVDVSPAIETELEIETGAEDVVFAPEGFDGGQLDGPAVELIDDLDVSLDDSTLAVDLSATAFQETAPSEGGAGLETFEDDSTVAAEAATAMAEEEPPAVRREEDLLAEAVVFSKYGLNDKARDRLQDLQAIHADHPGGLQLEIRMSLEAGDTAHTVELANRLAMVAQESGDSSIWDEVKADLSKAGFSTETGGVALKPEQPKKASGDRIAQLLEDLSLEDLGAPERARKKPAPAAEMAAPEAVDDDTDSEDATVSLSRDMLTEALDEVRAATLDDEVQPESTVPAAAPTDLLSSTPAEPVAARPEKKLFSLADELDLDDLDDDEEEAIEAPVADAAPSSVDPMDETGMSWLDDVEPESPQASAQVETIFDEEDDFFDLAAELERELSEEELAADDGIVVQPQEQSLEEIIEGFKQGVADNLSPEDYDTHYNLGIAYLEMGLVDEAIGEFQLACKDDRYLVDSSSMLGQCFLEKGLPELAVRWYRKGLESPDIKDEVSMSLLYEMGNAYVSLGDQDAAYKTFVEIYGINSNYRDVASRLQDLQGSAPQ